MTGQSLQAGCLHSLVLLPAAQPRPRSAAAPQTGLCSASVRRLLFPRLPAMAPPLLGHSLLPPPRRHDEPDGLGRRKVPDKRVLAPQPRGIATVPMQTHGVITPGRREIRHYLALDKPSRAVTQGGGETSCLLHGEAGRAASSMHLTCELLCRTCHPPKIPVGRRWGGVDALGGTWVLALAAFGQAFPKQLFEGGVA